MASPSKKQISPLEIYLISAAKQIAEFGKIAMEKQKILEEKEKALASMESPKDSDIYKASAKIVEKARADLKSYYFKSGSEMASTTGVIKSKLTEMPATKIEDPFYRYNLANFEKARMAYQEAVDGYSEICGREHSNNTTVILKRLKEISRKIIIAQFEEAAAEAKTETETKTKKNAKKGRVAEQEKNKKARVDGEAGEETETTEDPKKGE